jgi:imidazolonepropionase
MNHKENSQHADLIIKNVNIMTMSEGADIPYGLIEDAAIAVANGKVVWCGSVTSMPVFEAKQVLNGEGKFLSPGLIDCHTHLVFGGNRANEFEMRLTGVSYEEIAKQGGGILSTVNATREANEDTLYQLAEERVKTLMQEGVTSLEIKSGYGLDTPTEAKMLRVARRVGKALNINVRTTFLGAHALPAEYKNNADGYIDLICSDMLPYIAEQELADAVDGFCEGIGFSPSQMARVFETAKEYDLPVKLHAEQLSDLSGAELVANHQGLSADHLEYLSEKSILAMKQNGTVAVLLPGAFYTLSETKLPPMELLRKHQVPMAVASDYNPGSSPLCSLKLMLHMACTQFKMTPEEAISGVTRNAAKALGLNTKGTIEVGQDADLCLWNIEHPAELAYTYGVNPLSQCWVAGVAR